MSGGAEADRAFLAWGEGSNAAAIILVYAEKVLGARVRTDEGATPDGLDLSKLLLGLEELAEPGLAAHTETLIGVSHDAGRLAAWQEATQVTDEGVRYHHSAPGKALELYEDGRRRFEALGDRKGAGMCAGNIGLVHLERGDYAEAIEQCRAALALHEEVRYAKGQAMHLLNLRRAYGALTHWQEALEAAQRRAAIQRWAAPTLGSLWEADVGICQLELGARSDAQESYDRALAALPRLQLPVALEDLGALASRLGDAGRAEALAGETNAAIQQALQSLDPRPLTGAGPVLARLQTAVASDDLTMVRRAVSLSLPWSLMAIESLHAQAAYFLLTEDRASFGACEVHATALAYGVWRSFGLRWPLDEAMLVSGWDEPTRTAKAQAYGMKARALERSWSGVDGDEQAMLSEAKALHDLIGDHDAVGPWFPEAARAIEMDRVEMHTLVQMAETKASLGYTGEARDDLRSALAIAERDGDRLSVADKYVRLAILAHGERDMETASTWFEQAQGAFDEVEAIGVSAHDEPGRALNRIKLATHFGEYLNDARRPDEAWVLLGRALPAFEWFLEAYEGSGSLSDHVTRVRDYRGRALYAQARAAERLGLFENGLEVAREAAAWFESSGDRPGQAAAHHAIALVLRELGRYPEALAAAERDVALQREVGSDREIAVALTAAATITEATGDLEHARALGDEAAGLTEDPGPQSDAVFLLGRVASRQNEWAEAERRYQQALDLDRGRSDEAAVVADLVALAENHGHVGRVQDALTVAREAWQRASELPFMPDRISAGTALALALLAEGGPGAWSEAVQVLYEVCRMTERLRGALREEGHRIAQTGKGLVAHDLLVRALAAPTGPDAPEGLGAAAFDAVERAKARALVEAIASGAAAEAEADGVRLFRGIVAYVRDPREELTKMGFADILRLVQEECEAR